MSRRFLATGWLQVLLLLFVLLALSVLYLRLDPDELRVYSIFPFDSAVYLSVAQQLQAWQWGDGITAAYPWGPRLVFPAAMAAVQSLTDGSWGEAAFLVNLVAAICVCLITFMFWRRNGVPAVWAWLGVLLFAVGSHFPLRTASVYPGGAYALEVLTMFAAYLAIRVTGLRRIWLVGIPLILLASLSREFVSLLVVGYMFLHLGVIVLRRKLRARPEQSGSVLGTVLEELANRPTGRLFAITLTSIAGFVIARTLVQDAGGSYSPLRTVLTFSWFHLNLGETLYMLVFTLGPFAVALGLAVALPWSRRRLSSVLIEAIRNLDLVMVFSVFGFAFAIVGGTDSDRFLGWMFPFYGLIGLLSLRILWQSKSRQVRWGLVGLVVVGLLWSRFYVPAIPHLLFPASANCTPWGIVTNYDPALFVGPEILAGYRGPLLSLTPGEAYGGSTPLSNVQHLPGGFVQDDINSRVCPAGWSPSMLGPYEGAVNAIPVPFGFPHNQYELLVAHPWHGIPEIRAIVLAQWAVTFFSLLALCWRPLRRRCLESSPSGSLDP